MGIPDRGEPRGAAPPMAAAWLATIYLVIAGASCRAHPLGPVGADGGGSAGAGGGGASGATGGARDGGADAVAGAGGAAGGAGAGGSGGAGGTRPDAGPPDAAADRRDTGVDGPVPDRPLTCDCSHLPNIRTGVMIGCVGGVCSVGPSDCVAGFSHCTSNPNDGCETDLSRPESCGSCTNRCQQTESCFLTGSIGRCGTSPCSAGESLCGGICIDTDFDPQNCGGCGVQCNLPHALSSCDRGKCVIDGCDDPAWVDCTDAPGCETQVGSAGACLDCGVAACGVTGTVLTCDIDNSCTRAPCAPGFANCDKASADCEAALGSAPAGCFPQYLGTVALLTPTGQGTGVALGPDGSLYIGGSFGSIVDFDPGPGTDVRLPQAQNGDAFVTKLNADGSYAWTRTFSGTMGAAVVSVAAGADGSVVASGNFSGTADLDPGPGTDMHASMSTGIGDAFAVQLSAAGALVWSQVFASLNGDASGEAVSVSRDASGTYVAGWYIGDVSFGPSVTGRTDLGFQAPFIAKLDGGGKVLWARPGSVQCQGVMGSVSAAGGRVWAAGAASGTCDFSPAQNMPFSAGDVTIVSLDPSGGYRSASTLFGAPQGGLFGGASVVGLADGSVTAVGTFQGTVDFDPGPNVVRRAVPAASMTSQAGFVLHLSPAGAFAWATSIIDAQLGAVTAAPDGGVVAAGFLPTSLVIARVAADGSAVWTLGPGTSGQFFVTSAASDAAHFVIAGGAFVASDIDPGPGVEIVPGNSQFVTRYAF